ncbi:hypothetical protein G6F56_006834 [Rhizopus delemar]|nr:hypothetical protein G6F56_006834 [Rhizopus delemar]
MYGGIASRMAIELGLHENKESENANPTIEKLIEQETARKVFWCAFIMDKFCTAATGRPSGLHESFCSALLPANVNTTKCKQYYTESLTGDQYLLLNISCVRKSQLLGNFVDNACVEPHSGKKPSLDAYAYLVRATNILGKVTVFVNRKEKFSSSTPPYHVDSEVTKLDKMIYDWEENLPNTLKNVPANYELEQNKDQQSVLIMLHVLHNTLILLLHRPAMAIADTLDSEIVLPELKTFITNSLAKCIKAVDNVTVLVNKIRQRKDIIPPFLTYLVYTVATVVVSISFSPKEEEAQKAKQALPAYMKYLVVARGFWAMADKLYFMIRDLYTIHDKILKGQKELDSQPTPELYQQSPPNLFQTPIADPVGLTGTTTNLNDWNLPYYANAMSETAPDLGFYDELNNPLNFSSLLDLENNEVQMPGGLNFGFPYFTNPPGPNNE